MKLVLLFIVLIQDIMSSETIISKLKFKFRYHNGNLVNFSNNDFSFTLQFDCYRDEIARELKLRVPAQYRM